MMARLASEPAGRISQVFRDGASRQAAYDFVEHEAVRTEQVIDAIGVACARDCRDEQSVLVAVDGTSLSLTDCKHVKDLGSVGARKYGARGIKVMNTLAMTMEGVPLGVPTQQYWMRGERVNRRKYRSKDERESAHWRHAVDAVTQRFSSYAPHTRLHFVADREADASLFMQQLAEHGHDFTIRANGTRKVIRGRHRVALRPALARMPETTKGWLHLPKRAGVEARDVQLSIRVAQETLVLRDHHVHKRKSLDVFVVWAREVGRPPQGQARIEWLIYTTTPVLSKRSALAVLERYGFRWRIEEVHRTWKSGACNVEQMQLRTSQAAIKWACMLASVASRIERLKQLSREKPDAPASAELSDEEITVLRVLKRRVAKRTEIITEEPPTIAQAVRWIADLGGYVGNKSSGPPGATVIAKGLERLTWATEVAQALNEKR